MELPSSQAGCKSLARSFIGRIYAGYNYPMTSVRSSICTGTRCAAAPLASGDEGGGEYANMSKAWYLTAAVAGARTMAPTQPPKTSGQGSLWFDNGYLKSMLTHGPKFDNGYYKAIASAGCSELVLSRAIDARGSVSDCDDPAFPKDPAFLAVRQFAKDEKAWLQAFMEAWWIGTTNAQGGLNFLTQPRAVPKNAGSCGRQHQKASCASMGCAWNGTLCSGGVELSWGIKWNELHMLVPLVPPPAAPPPALGAPPPHPAIKKCSTPLVDRVTQNALHVGDWGGLCSCPSGNAGWAGDVAPSYNQTIIPPDELPPQNDTYDRRDQPAGLACVGGTRGKSTKHDLGEWSHTMIQVRVRVRVRVGVRVGVSLG